MLLRILFNKFIPKSIKHDALSYSYGENIICSALVACLATPIYAALYYVLNYSAAAYVILLTGFVIISAAFLLPRLKSLFWTRQIIVSALFLCLAYLSYGLGGINSAAAFWFILPPLITIFLGGMKDSCVWGLLCVCTVLLLFIVEYFNLPLPSSPISNELVLQTASISGLIIIILALVYLFELGKRGAAQAFKEANQQLTLMKEQAEQLAKEANIANRLKSEFLANMSHELRTPLNGIIGFTELIASGKTGVISKEQHEYLGDISTSAHHLLELINDILDLSKIEAGKLVFHSELVNLNTLLLEVKDSLQILLDQKQLHFTLEIDPPLAQVIIDPQKLKQVIYNYLSNAIKFTQNGGKIRVHIFYFGSKQFKIEIEDNGIGIKQEDLQYLFTAFQQLDPGFSKKYQGTGLGLALTRRLVEAQGGSVGVKSEFGKGSVFFVILPCWPVETTVK